MLFVYRALSLTVSTLKTITCIDMCGVCVLNSMVWALLVMYSQSLCLFKDGLDSDYGKVSLKAAGRDQWFR